MAITLKPENDGSLTLQSDGIDFLNLSEHLFDGSNLRVYTANDTWTKPDGLKYVIVEAIGAGGGGSTRGTQGKVTYAGAGGGGGGYARRRISEETLGDTEAVTVGAGGTASKTGTTNTDGGNGGTSSFGSHVSASGGTGGQKYDAAAPATTSSVGGTGGTGSNGDINVQGSDAQSNTSNFGLPGGQSGLSFGASGVTVLAATANIANGRPYGGGGSGGFSTGTNNAGTGADGLVLVYEFFN
jgi:hypothetical protein